MSLSNAGVLAIKRNVIFLFFKQFLWQQTPGLNGLYRMPNRKVAFILFFLGFVFFKKVLDRFF
jgi:hypothetical protein